MSCLSRICDQHFGVVSEIGVKEIPRRRFSWQDCGGEIMDGNKDEGLRCIRIAEEAIASGNKERALGFIKIARRLNRSLRVDELLTAWEEIDSGLPSSSSDEKRAGKVESVFGWVKHVDGLSGERNYAIEHVQLVRQINATKDYYRILGVDNASSAE
ncbi:chaperone protein dnaJ 49-like [Cucurbita pepo subsp. pepo]|uniref:chaperone protein dnaJ 49-like n=1 Tax=Cucurbita pepo subsp. pepo TaxID=3664 RepID=UPI000C9D5D61|nr:chaperone protein dnaJ 49-like [Cucurbita pepo subsp. pepo]